MSSGIPNLPKKQLRPSADAADSDEDNPSLQEQDPDQESDAESGEPTSDVEADASVVDDDSSSSNSITSEGGSDDEDNDELGKVDSSDDDDERETGEDNPSKKNKKKPAVSTRKKNMEDDMTLLGVPHGIHFDDDDSEDEDDERDNDSAEYFQKLKNSVRESYVNVYHPESMSHNYDEIQTLARVVRNSAGVIVDDLHRTIPIMTKYEKTRILGQRAKQINEGAPAFIKIDSTVIDGYLIAVKELEQKKTPFIIRRPLPNGGSEYWRVQDLEIL